MFNFLHSLFGKILLSAAGMLISMSGTAHSLQAPVITAASSSSVDISSTTTATNKVAVVNKAGTQNATVTIQKAPNFFQSLLTSSVSTEPAVPASSPTCDAEFWITPEDLKVNTTNVTAQAGSNIDFAIKVADSCGMTSIPFTMWVDSNDEIDSIPASAWNSSHTEADFSETVAIPTSFEAGGKLTVVFTVQTHSQDVSITVPPTPKSVAESNLEACEKAINTNPYTDQIVTIQKQIDAMVLADADYSKIATLDGESADLSIKESAYTNEGCADIELSRPITAICNDETFSYSQSDSGTCSYHGGVMDWINKPD